MWDHYDGSWIVATAMALVMTGFVVLVALILVSLRDAARSGGESLGGAQRILAERLARGEIDLAEYHDRLAALVPPTDARVHR